jgi:hypothetical protein
MAPHRPPPLGLSPSPPGARHSHGRLSFALLRHVRPLAPTSVRVRARPSTLSSAPRTYRPLPPPQRSCSQSQQRPQPMPRGQADLARFGSSRVTPSSRRCSQALGVLQPLTAAGDWPSHLGLAGLLRSLLYSCPPWSRSAAARARSPPSAPRRPRHPPRTCAAPLRSNPRLRAAPQCRCRPAAKPRARVAAVGSRWRTRGG